MLQGPGREQNSQEKMLETVIPPDGKVSGGKKNRECRALNMKQEK
ncbi:hypothetical protein [Methanosarcina sp. WWM596]|nr:hypothetical protein [Methanosarcina sp. WWM596]